MAYKRMRSFSISRPPKRARVYRKKRRVFKRKTRRSRRGRISRYGGGKRFGFRDQSVVKMYWNAIETVTIPDATVQKYTSVKVNCPRDPYAGVIGTFNQFAAGYKLMNAVYTKYCVLGAKLVVTIRPSKIFNAGTSQYASKFVNWQPIKWGVKLDEDEDISGITNRGWEAAVTDTTVRHKTYDPYSVDGRPSRIVVKYSARKMWDVSNPRDDDEVGALFGNDPVKKAYAIVWAQVMDKTTTLEQTSFSIQYQLYMTVAVGGRRDAADFSAHNPDMVQE